MRIVLLTLVFLPLLTVGQEKKYTFPMYLQEVNQEFNELLQKHDDFVNLVNNSASKVSVDLWKSEFDELAKEVKKSTKKAKAYKGDDSYYVAMQKQVEHIHSKDYENNLDELLEILLSEEWQSDKTTTNPKYKEIEALYKIRQGSMQLLTNERNQVYENLTKTYQSEIDQFFSDSWYNLKIDLKNPTKTGKVEFTDWGKMQQLNTEFMMQYPVYQLMNSQSNSADRFVVHLYKGTKVDADKVLTNVKNKLKLLNAEKPLHTLNNSYSTTKDYIQEFNVQGATMRLIRSYQKIVEGGSEYEVAMEIIY